MLTDITIARALQIICGHGYLPQEKGSAMEIVTIGRKLKKALKMALINRKYA